MQKIIFSSLFLSAVAGLFADTSLSPPVPYDSDLFNKDKVVYFVNAEFLYWLVNESALQYAIQMNEQAPEHTGAVGTYQNTDFHWAPGGRINFGYFNAPHFWDSFIQYTYLSSTGSAHVKDRNKAGEYLNGTWEQPDLEPAEDPATLTRASSHINLTYNLIDFLFSRRFDANEHLRINLFGGLTAAVMHQHWSVHYHDLLDNDASIRNQWRFGGLGIRVGARVDWYMGWDLYLTGTTSAAILSGWYKNTAHEKSSTTSASPLHTSYEDHRLTSTAQMLLGPAWQKRFSSIRTEIFVGYELTAWTNLQEVYRSNHTLPQVSKTPWINTSLLTLQGLTARWSIDF